MKIIVSDFDNTFYTAEYEKNVQLIKSFIEKGNKFIIATGRPIYLLKPDIEDYNLDCSYIVCNDGGVIFDSKGKKIFEENIDKEVAKEVYELLSKDDNFEEVFIDTALNFSKDINDTFNAILALPKDKKIAQKQIDELMKKYPSIQGYISHRWLNILNKNSSKGNAIKMLMNMNNWSYDDVITIGDNYNDVSMLENFNSFIIKGDKNIEDKAKYVVNNFKEMLEIIDEGN